jgi:hypothetical protein
VTVGTGNRGEVRMENGRPLQATTNSFSPFRPRLQAVGRFGLGSAMLTPEVMVGGKFKLTEGVGNLGGFFFSRPALEHCNGNFGS